MDEFFLFLEIMLINVVLSGDNAVVIGMASKNLPFHQRKLAVWWGAFGAIALRVVLTIAAVMLLQVPFIQAVGAFLLAYISIKLLMDDGRHLNIKQAATLRNAVWTIMVADIIMSLDNVLAIAAVAEGDYTLIILGVGISIPLIIWGSSFIMKLLQRYPILIYMGAGVLGYTAGEMLVNDEKVRQLFMNAHPSFHWFIPIFFTAVVILAGLYCRKPYSYPKV